MRSSALRLVVNPCISLVTLTCMHVHALPVTTQFSYDGAFWGIGAGNGAPQAPWLEQAQLELGLDLNSEQRANNPAIASFKALMSLRWRDPADQKDPGQLVGASALFDPSDWGSGTGLRLLQIGIDVEAGPGSPGQRRYNLIAGWIQPQQQFLQQPLSKLVLNHAVLSAKGVGGNIPFVSSFSTWGATLAWRPNTDQQLKGGLFMTYPDATQSSNHGLWFGGNPSQPSQNRMMGIVEWGSRHRLGQQRLPGLWALGAYVYGFPGETAADSFNTAPQVGGYLQLDQTLWQDKQLSSRRLDGFSVIALAPEFNNPYPFYGHLGLAFQGPWRSRPADVLIGTMAYGSYSAALGSPSKSSSLIAEMGYQLSLDRAETLFLYPYLQVLIRPDGTSTTPDALLAGLAIRVRL